MKNTKSIREKTCATQSKNSKYNGLKKEKISDIENSKDTGTAES